MIGSRTTADKRLAPGSTVTGCLTMVTGTVITLVVPLVQRRCRGRRESPTESSRRSVSLCGTQEPTVLQTMTARGSCQPFVVVTKFRKTFFFVKFYVNLCNVYKKRIDLLHALYTQPVQMKIGEAKGGGQAPDIMHDPTWTPLGAATVIIN